MADARAEWSESVPAVAASTGLSGVVQVDRAGEVVFSTACGLADRRAETPCSLDVQFAMASGCKAFTALATMALVEDGALSLSTRARSLLGGDLPQVSDDVTIEHLLSHRSGVGDYVDEESDLDLNDYVLTVPIHTLAHTAGYLPAIDGQEQKFTPGERFAYSNAGYVLLAVLAERAGGQPFHDLVRDRVLSPAGMDDTAYLRSDELPPRAAIGYLEPTGFRTNVLHLPVRGSGDGGAYTTVADVSLFWQSLFAGKIVSAATLASMITPRSDVPEQRRRYGYGFWLPADGGAVMIEGCDAGVSFFSWHDPADAETRTVICNTADGAWDVAELFETGP